MNYEPFKFSFNIGLWDFAAFPVDVDAAALMHAIELSCGDRLEALAFYLESDTKGTPIQSMESFRRLKQLELDTDVLLAHDNFCFATMVGAHCPCVRTLGEVLPSSIERVCLVVADIRRHIIQLQRLLSDISVGDNSKLPNLREVIIRTKAREKWERSEHRLNSSLGMAIGCRINNLGTHMGTENDGVPTNDFFLPLKDRMDVSFGASSADVSVAKTSVPPPQNLATQTVRVSVVRLDNLA